MMLRDLHYGWPGAVNLTLMAIVLAFLLFYIYRYRQAVLQKKDLLFVPRSRLFYALQSLFFLIAWLAAMLALMQPLANGHYPEGQQPKAAEQKLRRPAHEVVFLVDASSSMETADMHNGQTRLQYVKQLADEIVSELDGEQVSLYAFTSGLAALSPPTLDYLFVRLMLDQLSLNEDGFSGTDFYTILIELRKRLLQTPLSMLKTVVIFSDGGDTAIEAAAEGEKPAVTSALLKLAAHYLKLNARIYTVGMGSAQGGEVPNIIYEGKPVVSRLNESLLKQIATAGHGKYVNANRETVINSARLLADEFNALSTGAQGQDISHLVMPGEENLIYDHYFQVPLALAIAALLLAMYIPDARKAVPIWVGLLAMSSIHADGVRTAEVWLEASQHAKAIEVVELLSNPKLAEWQNQTLIYNKGTIFLAQGNWEEAISTFSAIPLTGDPPPVLLASIKLNLGIALLEKGRSLQLLVPAPYAVILALQQEAIRLFDQASSIEMSNTDARPLQRLALIEYASTLGKSQQALLADSSLQEGLPTLLVSLSNALGSIDFMEMEWVDDKLKARYLRLFMREQEAWAPLWESQQRQWALLADGRKEEGQRFYLEAKRHSDQAQFFMQKGLFSASRKEVEQASSLLIDSMRILFGKDPLKSVLQRLLASYKRALSQEVLTEASLKSIEKEQRQLMQVGKSDDMNKALDHLKLSLQALAQQGQEHARFFLEMAKEDIRYPLALQPQNPESLLQELIAEQTFSNTILSLTIEMATPPANSKVLLEKAQTEVLHTALRFSPLVLKQQTERYSSSGQHRCQAKPWDEVLPLFEKGREEGARAKKSLVEGGLKGALQHQGRALLAWYQALAALKKPVADSSSPCQSDAKPQESQGSSSPSQQPVEGAPKPKKGSGDVLRVLQELNQDDKLPKTDQGTKKKGLRPW